MGRVSGSRGGVGEQVVAPGVVVVRELIGVSGCGCGEGVGVSGCGEGVGVSGCGYGEGVGVSGCGRRE